MNTTIHPELIVSVSGIRGIIGTSLTPDVACAFAMALGNDLGGGKVVVSRDSRPSGEMLRHAVISGLLATGCDVLDLGIAPTPTCGIAVRELRASGAIQITASHNPSPWNGLKMFGADGAVLTAERGAAVKQRFLAGAPQLATWDRIGPVSDVRETIGRHLQLVRSVVDVASIQNARFRVLVDGNGGAGGPLAVALLRALGCEVIEQACAADGHFVHEAEPIPAHLTSVAPLVALHRAAVGFVLDPDADRLALIDETGQCLSEELTLALAVQERLGEQAGPVVINMSTSRVIEDLAGTAGGTCLRSAVGEANVVALMRSSHAVIGGEGNGGVIDPRIGWVRDPYIGMALILQGLARRQQTLSQAIAALPTYAMLKTKYSVSREALPAALRATRQRWPDARVNEIDGLRLDWSDRWVHIRGSNTEPVVRVIAEAPTLVEAEELCRETAQTLQG